MERFIGREHELARIRDVLAMSSASVMVYGKRKVGKTTLITHALKDSSDTTIYYECLKAPLRENTELLVAELVRCGVLPVPLAFASLVDVFSYLNTLPGTYNIVIDEYPYLKVSEKPDMVDSLFQKIIDNHIGNIRLFLSGSHIGMMKDMLAESNALYGRFSLTLKLGELDYREAAAFYPKKSVHEKIAFHAVFGGSPFVCTFINPDLDLRANVIRTVLNPVHPLYGYVEHLVISDYVQTAGAERILSAISNGKKKYGEIERILDMKNNGLLSKQISALLDMEIISRNYPINRKGDRKKTSYELCDNLLRFYYAFVYRNRSALQMIGAEAFYDSYIADAITTLISHRFEELCRSYFSMRVRSGEMRGVTNIGTCYYDDSAAHANGELHVVLERTDVYDIYEVKYFGDPLQKSVMLQKEQKIRSLKGLKVGRIGFISSSGFETTDVPYDLIDGEMLYF